MIYLFYGNDKPAMKFHANQIIDALEINDFNLSIFKGVDERIIFESSFPPFGDDFYRCLFWEDIDFRSSKFLDRVIEATKNKDDVLVFCFLESPDKRSKSFKKLLNISVEAFEKNIGDYSQLKERVERVFETEGLQIEDSVEEDVIYFLQDKDANFLYSELDKISNIDSQEDLIFLNQDSSCYSLVYSILAKNSENSIKEINNLLQQYFSPSKIIAILISEFHKFLSLKLGVDFSVKSSVLKYLDSWSVHELYKFIFLLLNLQLYIQSADYPYTFLELFIKSFFDGSDIENL